MRGLLVLLLMMVCSRAQDNIPEGQRAWPGPKSSHALFESYKSRGFSKWKQHWTYRYDLTGVSMEKDRAATLITKRHVVMAKHFPRKVGDRIHFHDRSGKAVVRTLVKIAPMEFDVAVGLLDKAVPKSLAIYPLPKIDEESADALVGRRVLVTDKTRHLHVSEVGGVLGGVFLKLRHSKDFKAKKLIGGDSGNPSFLLVRGGLVLVETHFFGGAGSGPFFGSSKVQAEIDKGMKELGVVLPVEFIDPLE